MLSLHPDQDKHQPLHDGFAYYPRGYEGKGDKPLVRNEDGDLVEVDDVGNWKTIAQEYALEGRTKAAAAGSSRTLQSKPPPKNKLTMTCNNQLCDMVLYLLVSSCLFIYLSVIRFCILFWASKACC